MVLRQFLALVPFEQGIAHVTQLVKRPILEFCVPGIDVGTLEGPSVFQPLPRSF